MDLLTIPLETSSPTPLYRQLYGYLREEILTGRLTSGDRLPSKRQLASQLGISQNTVMAAYEQLVEEGYLLVRPQSGYYVCQLDRLPDPILAPPVSGKAPGRADCRYDFTPHGVDQEHFPFSVWRRLYREAITATERTLLSAGDPQGEYSLRAAIASYLHRSRGVICTPEQIIISSGTEFLFQLLIQIFPDDCLYALENPGYAKLGRLFFGCRAAFAAVDLDRHGIRPDLLRQSGAAVACITPSHQFPTGTIMPVRRRTELLHWAAEQPERYLIEDDYDSEFKHEGRSIPALQGMDTRHRVIYMGTFSKSVSSAMRVSYMVLPVPLLTVYQKRLTFYHCPVPLLEQLVLCRFIESGAFERHLNRMRVLYRKKHDILLEELKNLLPQAEILDANAGLHLLLRLPGPVSAETILQRGAARSVKLYSLSDCYLSPSEQTYPTGSSTCLLLGYAQIPLDALPDAVCLLARIVNGV